MRAFGTGILGMGAGPLQEDELRAVRHTRPQPAVFRYTDRRAGWISMTLAQVRRASNFRALRRAELGPTSGEGRLTTHWFRWECRESGKTAATLRKESSG